MCLKNKFLILFFFLLIKGSLLGQSISLYGGYPYYFLQLKEYGDYTDARNKTNYVMGFYLGKAFKSSKVEIGFAYGTKNYYLNYRDIYSSLEREDIQLSYYLIPLIYNHQLFANSKNNFFLSVGTVFLKPFGYSKEALFKDDTKTKEENIPIHYKLGNTARIGLRYSKDISNKFILFLDSYADYKFNLDYYESGSSLRYFNLTNDRFGININLGIEYSLKKETKPLNKKEK